MMMSKYKGAFCAFGKYIQNNQSLIPSPVNCSYYNFQQHRNIAKHWNPKFRKLRREKVIKVELPKFDEDTDSMTQDRYRSMLKQRGLLPQRNWNERPILISSTSTVLEPYIVPEGDGKYSTITKEGAKQKIEFIEKKGKSYMAVRKIKSYEEDFSMSTFPEHAVEIYKKAHNALVNKDKDQLLQYVTEFAYPKMLHNVEDKTIVWKFLESLEPARIVHVRCADVITKTNIFAQITVRIHAQQILCIYDRFGRLLKGSEILRKDVLDYIIFEKHLSNEYGTWRLHAKIIPSWLPPEEIAAKTYMLPKKVEETSLTAKDAEDSVAVTTSP
ncbi:mitochondrial ribosomal protein L45 [Lasioglossum baleicum]|uniref:mitochondrial ribosomal protein L45 n=1 Tax=Lasioglossum baleicum TaxID=434251 RepID=UPI003FCE111F